MYRMKRESKCRYFIKISVIFSFLLTKSHGLVPKCDQKPPLASVDTPKENDGVFVLEIGNGERRNGRIYYTPDQTYVLTVRSTIPTRTFNWFMITAEDPAIDSSTYDFGTQMADVGILKTLGLKGKSQYSERCKSSVENIDSSYKSDVEIHWISPKKVKGRDQNNIIRIRAMVAENREAWYTGDNLTLYLYMDDKPSKDTPPLRVKTTCNLCSEARYEVVFHGKWSRLTHPRHYPSKPDDNGYSHMVGASHGNNFTLWSQGSNASDGLKLLAETANSTLIEDEIIKAMSRTNGARTLIRGKRRHHPHMFEGSHSLFRVDRTYHMFSLVVGLRPSPDWFLGTSNFELCDENEWLPKYELPLYPWDAGTMNGVSYESQTSMTQPTGNVERVEVGSFNKDSPFYQINLNDLKPFANLIIKRLDVYPRKVEDCAEEDNEADGAEEDEDMQQDQPMSSSAKENCEAGEWSDWTPCTPQVGTCGLGKQTRTRKAYSVSYYGDYEVIPHKNKQKKALNRCASDDTKLIQYQDCNVEC